MANQPPARPWFRLASLRPIPPPSAPAPAPAQPETRPAVVRPAFRTSSAPSSPATRQPATAPAPAPAPETHPPAPAPAPAPDQAQQETRPVVVRPTFRTSSAPSSPLTRAPPPAEVPIAPPQQPPVERRSVPPSPVQKAPSPVQKASSPVQRVPSPVQKGAFSAPPPAPSDLNGESQSPKTIKPAVQAQTVESPKVKPITPPPPSPLVLPPAQTTKPSTETGLPPEVEAEQKTVLYQKMVEKPKQKMNSEKASIVHHHHHEKHGGHREMTKKAEDSEMRVITIAGENRGAFMEVTRSPNKPNKKGTKDGSETEKSSEGEADEKNLKKKGKVHKWKSSSSWPMTAFLNSNVQSVNNSLMYNSSCTQHDPGVRFVLSKKPIKDGFQIKEEKN